MEKITIEIHGEGLSIKDVMNVIDRLPKNQHEIIIQSHSGQKIHARTPKYSNHLTEILWKHLKKEFDLDEIEDLHIKIKKGHN